jgi:hypothetical protein
MTYNYDGRIIHIGSWGIFLSDVFERVVGHAAASTYRNVRQTLSSTKM